MSLSVPVVRLISMSRTILALSVTVSLLNPSAVQGETITFTSDGFFNAFFSGAVIGALGAGSPAGESTWTVTGSDSITNGDATGSASWNLENITGPYSVHATGRGQATVSSEVVESAQMYDLTSHTLAFELNSPAWLSLSAFAVGVPDIGLFSYSHPSISLIGPNLTEFSIFAEPFAFLSFEGELPAGQYFVFTYIEGLNQLGVGFPFPPMTLTSFASYDVTVTVTPTAVPEPASLLLVASGLAATALRRRVGKKLHTSL